jgi:hypothetical protein
MGGAGPSSRAGGLWFIAAAGYADPRNAKGTVVHFHGNAQSLSAHWRYVEWLPICHRAACVPGWPPRRYPSVIGRS